jgi:hypothetical protein
MVSLRNGRHVMLEILPAPDAVMAIRATGRLDEADIERAAQAVDAALVRHERIALYAEIDIDGITPGALVRDVGHGLGKLQELHRFPQVAVVTGQDWVRWIARVEETVLPGIEVKVFPPSQKDVAMAWISEPLPPLAVKAEPAGPSIHLIETSKPEVVAFEIDGRVGADDTRRLTSIFDQAMDEHDRLRMFVRIRNFDGVTLEALRQEGLFAAKMRGWDKVGRYALVGGPAWLQAATRGLAPLVGIETRIFAPEDEADAWTWIGAEPGRAAAGDGAGGAP